VGAGLAGLVAANRLVDAGLAVTVLDGAGHAGGRAHTTVDDGACRNLGPHAVYRRGALASELAALGIDVPGSSPSVVRPRVLVDGTDHLSGGLALRWAGSLLRLRRRPGPGLSLAGWLDDVGLDGVPRSLVEALARTSTYANAPDLIDAAAARAQMLLALGGVIYVDGGWVTLVTALAQRLRQRGGTLHTGAGVDHVDVGPNRVRVHGRDGELHEADAAVLAVGGPADAAGLVGDQLGADLAARTDVAVRMASLDLVLDAADGQIGPTAVLGDGRDPRYLVVQSRVADVAPANREVVHVARYLASDEKADAATRADLEALVERFRPGWRNHVLQARFLPNLTVTHALPLASHGGRSGRAPVVPDPTLPVALAGDGFGDTGMLSDAAAASATLAARHVAARVRAPAATEQVA